jgi:hypothetical protein
LTGIGALDENPAGQRTCRPAPKGDVLNRFQALASLAVAASLLALPAAPSRAQSAEWNQEKVTELAEQLADVVAELQAAFRREAPVSRVSAQARARHRFADSLRVLRVETRALASSLESGAGLDETWPIARRARMLIRDLREEGRRMSWAEPVSGHAQRAEELIAQLAPFYFDANVPVGSEQEKGG